jgi:hypothetical protein
MSGDLGGQKSNLQKRANPFFRFAVVCGVDVLSPLDLLCCVGRLVIIGASRFMVRLNHPDRNRILPHTNLPAAHFQHNNFSSSTPHPSCRCA